MPLKASGRQWLGIGWAPWGAGGGGPRFPWAVGFTQATGGGGVASQPWARGRVAVQTRSTRPPVPLAPPRYRQRRGVAGVLAGEGTQDLYL